MQYYIGVDLGGIHIAAGIVDETGNIITKGAVPTGRTRPFTEIMKDMADLCQKLIKDASLSATDVKVIGIGCPGTVDTEDVKVVYANNLPDFSDKCVGDELKKYFPHVEVYIENDANAAAFGEMIAGAAKGEKDVIMVTLGTGVGGGMIIGGKLYSGHKNAGGELGHMVIERNGLPCTCGRNGCWEVYASATGLIAQTEEKIKAYPDSIIHKMAEENGNKINGKIPFDAMQAGDPAATAIVEQYLEYVSIGVVDLINVFAPKKLVIGGGISHAGDALLKPVQAYAATHVYGTAEGGTCVTEIALAELGNDAGIIGAAMLFKQYE